MKSKQASKRNKNQKRIPHKVGKRELFFGVIIILIIVILLGYRAYGNKDQVITQNQNKQMQMGINVSGWKTYVNSKYGFQITYPTYCLNVLNNTEGKTDITPIDPSTQQGYGANEIVEVGDSFGVYEFSWDKTLQEYITSIKKGDYKYSTNDLYNLEPITSANADEAIAFRIKPGMGQAADYDNAPFTKTIALYKKNNQIFTLNRFQNGGFGCTTILNSPTLTPDDIRQIDNVYQGWDIPSSFKFIN